MYIIIKLMQIWTNRSVILVGSKHLSVFVYT